MTETAALPKRATRAPGDESRARILDVAASLATVHGLGGLSIGGLAEAVGMPKSSVYVLFGSKEELQLATVDHAGRNFVGEVIEPTARAEPGLGRLLALSDAFLSYVQRRVFPGGCFFVSAAADVGAQAGLVHDRVARFQREWTELLQRHAQAARERGELDSAVDADQLAFEIGAILAGANLVAVLHGSDVPLDRARRAVHDRLEAAGTGGS
jgi:AcrR family transcriptional regulator